MWGVTMALTVEIVTPTSVAYSGEANQVLAPGFLGEFGILPEHTLYLSAIKAGVVEVHSDGETTRFVVGRGFAEAGPDRLTLLTELCETAEDIDKAAAATLLDESEKTLTTADPNSSDWAKANHKAELARARMAL
tara:strand:+ start:391 stop:795 length:405 start_codon:yes stop_codon:yes gene_type:complete